jgi:hypothetical protein
LAAPLAASGKATDSLLRLAATDVANGSPIAAGSASASDAFERYAAAASAVFAHLDAAARSLDGLLAARERRLTTHRALLVGLVASALVVVTYLWLAFYVAVRRAVQSLDEDVLRRIRPAFQRLGRDRQPRRRARSSCRSTAAAQLHRECTRPAGERTNPH